MTGEQGSRELGSREQVETDGRRGRPGHGLRYRSRPAWLPEGRGVGWFAAAGLVNALGTGFFYPYQLLFFPAVTGMKLATIGVCLTVATLVALPLVLQVGRLVDRFDTRPVLVAAALLRAAGFVAYLMVHQVMVFVVIAVVVAVCQRAEQTAMPVLAAAAAPDGQVSRWIALTKVTFNAGIGLGGLVAGAVLTVAHTRSGFVVVGLANAASFALAALLYLPLPSAGPGGRARVRRPGRPWHDRLYLRVAVVNFVLLTVIVTTEAALPVFAVNVLGDPSWVVGALFAVNTVFIVLLQLPVSARISAEGRLRAVAFGVLLHAGLLVLLGCVHGVSLPVQLVLLIPGMALYTLGELMATQALAVLLVALPPPEERGTYQAFNQVLVGVSLALVPALVAVFMTQAPSALWWVLVAVVVLAAADVLRLRRRDGAAIAAAEQ